MNNSDDLIGVEIPWLFTKVLGAIHLNDKQGFNTWLNQTLPDGEMGMVIVVPLTTDAYHQAAFRYYRGCVLPLIANDLGEPNLETAHDTLAGMFLPLVPVKAKDAIKFRAKSTAMLSMACAQFCDYLDRLIVWATTDRGLIIPMADPAWKWKRERTRAA